jgi:hypothetical protein
MLVKRAILVGLASLTVALAPVAPSSAERAEAPSNEAARSVAKQLVAGMYFTCSLANSGSIRCWGDNTYGQLGNGLTNSSGETSSVGVLGISDATEITAGAYHACARLADSRVKCWGYGFYGQLGHGSYGTMVVDDRSTPAFVQNSAGTADLTGVESVAAGYDHTCALMSADGSVKCWGSSNSGTLGNGSLGTTMADWKPLPVSVKTNASTDLTGATELTAAQNGGCVIVSGGGVKCWGMNGNGQLGIGSTTASEYAVDFGGGTPVTGVIAISKASGHTCVVKSTDVLCAGGASNAYVFGQQIGRTSPWPLSISGAKQVVTSDNATCILGSDSTVACAGGIYVFETPATFDADGAGAGPRSSFAAITELAGAVGLVAGGQHLCASLASEMKCWGRNNYGQLGNGSRSATGSSGPVSVVGIQAATISISDPGAKNVGSPAFTLSATSSAGGSVTLSIDSSSILVCSISGVTVTILGAGSCVVNGTSPPSGIYSAGSGSRTIAVSALAPTIGAGTATSLSVSGATISAEVNPKGGTTTVSLEYGTSAILVGATSVSVSGSFVGVAALTATKELTGLSPAVTYYFRFTVTNSVGSSVGEIASFVTSGAKPTISSTSASPETYAATLAADVNANEVDSTVSFEYGSDSTLSTVETVAVVDPVTGSTAKSVTATISKLKPGAIYFYRVIAVNSVGTTRGEAKSFTTKGSKPSVVTGSAVRTAAGMTLNGKVNPKDLETTIQFGYGTDPKLVGSSTTPAVTRSGAVDEDLSAVVTGLTENTTYYYRIIASNAVGSVEGEIRSFTTTKAEGVSINDGEEFTSSQSVTVSVVGPSTAVKAILSNDGGFKTSETFDLVNNAAEIPWQLQSSREGTFTKIVYVKYVSRFGSQSTPYTDDIILDTTKPVVSTATAAAGAAASNAVTVSRVGVSAKKAAGGVRLSVRGSDTVSGIGTIEVRSAANKPAVKVKIAKVSGKADGKPRVASQTVSLKTTAKRLQVRVLDRAGNASAWRTIVVK